jgi:hypothetical protein
MGCPTNGKPKVPGIITTTLRHSDMAVGFIVTSLYMAGENISIWRHTNPGLDATPSRSSSSGLHHSTSQQRNSLLPSCLDPAILFRFSWKCCQAVWALLVRSPWRCLSSFKPFTRSGAHLSATTNWRFKKKKKKREKRKEKKQKKILRKLEDKTDLQMKQVALSFTCSRRHEYWNGGLSWRKVSAVSVIAFCLSVGNLETCTWLSASAAR